MPAGWLNYHHLMYFHAVAREGSVTAAARTLHLSQPTVSGQIRLLEESLGRRLFDRRGGRMRLTAAGREVFRYADEISGLGDELLRAVNSPGAMGSRRLSIGVADELPKAVVARVLAPLFQIPDGPSLEVHDGAVSALLVDLAALRLDLVLAHGALVPRDGRHLQAHALGATSLTFLVAPGPGAPTAEHFPDCLAGAPVLLPPPGTSLRQSLDAWFDRVGVAPRVVAEVADSALLQALARAGAGAVPVSSAVAAQVAAAHDLVPLGQAAGVEERYWAFIAERRLAHPGVQLLLDSARLLLD